MKKTFIFGIALFSFTALSAQTQLQPQEQVTAESEEIELPEVTTVISGESVKAGLDSLPDFKDVLEEPQDSGNVVPVLPEVEIKEGDNSSTGTAQIADKNIYAEGQLGGGYPSLFKGDFSVYRQDENPFTLEFHHNSQAGFAKKSLTQGYNTRDTSMSVERTFENKNVAFTFGGLYQSIGNGLQNKVINISDLNNDSVDGNAEIKWTLPKGFTLGAGAKGGFYNRYADITYAPDFYPPLWVQNVVTYDAEPSIFAVWSGHGFNIDLNGNFWFGGIKPCSKTVYNRGDFGLDFAWANEKVRLFGDVAAVFGNTVDEKALAPFCVGIEAAVPVSFANRKFAFGLEGGLSSERNSVSELEKQYRFTGFSEMPGESSLWYGKMNFSIPVKSSFTCNLGADFRKTAFGNGSWVPSYAGDAECGVYAYECRNVTFFTTDFDFTYHYKLVSVAAIWHSNWIDVPALEPQQMLKLNVSLQSEASKWGANLMFGLGLGDKIQAPVISLDSFFRVTPAVRIVFAAEDVIELCTGKGRTYAGQYVAEGGNVSVLVKFFF